MQEGEILHFENRNPFLHGSPGGGEQVPPAVLFFENKDPFLYKPWRRCTGCLRRVDFLKKGPLKTQVLTSLYRLPPAGRFFEKWTPKNTSFGVVVQVVSGGSIF